MSEPPPIAAYAHVYAAALRVALEPYERIDVPEGRLIETFNASDSQFWRDAKEPVPNDAVPVRMEVQEIGSDRGAIVAQLAIIDPIPAPLPARSVSSADLARICRAVGVMEVTDLDDLRYRPFHALVGTNCRVVRYFFPDYDAAPHVPGVARAA